MKGVSRTDPEVQKKTFIDNNTNSNTNTNKNNYGKGKVETEAQGSRQ